MDTMLHSHALIAPREIAQDLWQDLECDHWQGCDPQLGAAQLTDLGGDMFQAVEPVIHALDLAIELDRLAARKKPRAAALEKPESDPVLKIRDQPADGRLGNAERLRRRRDRAILHYRPKGLDLSLLHRVLPRCIPQQGSACPAHAPAARATARHPGSWGAWMRSGHA